MRSTTRATFNMRFPQQASTFAPLAFWIPIWAIELFTGTLSVPASLILVPATAAACAVRLPWVRERTPPTAKRQRWLAPSFVFVAVGLISLAASVFYAGWPRAVGPMFGQLREYDSRILATRGFQVGFSGARAAKAPDGAAFLPGGRGKILDADGRVVTFNWTITEDGRLCVAGAWCNRVSRFTGRLQGSDGASVGRINRVGIASETMAPATAMPQYRLANGPVGPSR